MKKFQIRCTKDNGDYIILEEVKCSECDMFSWDGTGDNPRRDKHILNVINEHFPYFLKEWEIHLIISDCIVKNARTDDDILNIIDAYLTGDDELGRPWNGYFDKEV